RRSATRWPRPRPPCARSCRTTAWPCPATARSISGIGAICEPCSPRLPAERDRKDTADPADRLPGRVLDDVLIRLRRSSWTDRLELRLLLIAERGIEILKRGAHQLDRLQHGIEPLADSHQPRGRRHGFVRLACRLP